MNLALTTVSRIQDLAVTHYAMRIFHANNEIFYVKLIGLFIAQCAPNTIVKCKLYVMQCNLAEHCWK